MRAHIHYSILYGLFLLTAASLSAGEYGQPKVIVPAPEETRHQHLSWPKAIKAEDGSIVVAYIAGRKHVNGDGCPAVSISKDGGNTFSSPKILMNFDSTMPYQHGANLALGKAGDGSLILMAMAFTDDLRNNIYGWRSEDNGKIWKRVDTSALGENKTGSVFGHVFAVEGKGLAVCGHYRKPKGEGLWIAYSKDEGKTWGAAETITPEKFFEPTFIYSSKRLIGLIRENSAHAYHQFTSDNLGESWQFQAKVMQGDKSAVHPSPFLIEDPTRPGVIFALQSERTKKREIYLWQAKADTLEWQRMGLVVSDPDAEDFGYPWMTHLEGDDWFLVYYAGETNGPNSIYGMKISIPR